MRLRLLITLLIGHAAWAQDPVNVSIEEVRNHLMGLPAIIHSKARLDLFQSDYVTLQVVVDEAGGVETVKAIAGPEDFRVPAESLESKRKFKPFEREGTPVRATFEDYVSIMPLEQWSDTKVPFPEIKGWSSLTITLKRTMCFGSCPDYSIELHGNGEVEFQGNSNVLITGHHKGTVSKQAVRNLLSVFRQADYFSLKDRYSYAVTDNPTYTTSIAFDKVKKSVVDYVGARAGMPDAVTEVEIAIDDLAGSEKWVKGNQETGPALVAEKWDFHSGSEENRALFSNVVARGSSGLIQLFIQNGAPALGLTNDGAGPLINAAKKGDFDLVKTLLTGQNELSPATMTCALGAAAHSGNLALVEFLIEKGASANGAPCGQYPKDTVLMNAIESGKVDVVQEVLKFPVDVNARNTIGSTPLAILVENVRVGSEALKMMELLLAAGADVNRRDDNGQTSLFYACQGGHADAVGLLIKAGSDVNLKDRNGQTVLMTCFGNSSVLKPIIDAGADLNIQNPFGRTAAEEARQMGAVEKAELLESAMKAKTQK